MKSKIDELKKEASEAWSSQELTNYAVVPLTKLSNALIDRAVDIALESAEEAVTSAGCNARDHREQADPSTGTCNWCNPFISAIRSLHKKDA